MSPLNLLLTKLGNFMIFSLLLYSSNIHGNIFVIRRCTFSIVSMSCLSDTRQATLLAYIQQLVWPAIYLMVSDIVCVFLLLLLSQPLQLVVAALRLPAVVVDSLDHRQSIPVVSQRHLPISELFVWNQHPRRSWRPASLWLVTISFSYIALRVPCTGDTSRVRYDYMVGVIVINC